MTAGTRAERAVMPLARDAIRHLTEAAGGCIRPVQVRRTDITTGQVTQVMLPCRATTDDKCPPCAKRAQSLRAAQCREGWHLDSEPDLSPAAPDETQEFWITARAHAQQKRDTAAQAGNDTAELDAVLDEIDDEIAAAGIRGSIAAHTGTGDSDGDGPPRGRRSRSTRRRQDAPSLPKRKVSDRTTGQVYQTPDGKTYRPSMFLTLTCDSYGKVLADGTPADPATYDYQRAARDAIHYPALFDRLVQNLRRYVGYDIQYFAAIEPQKRLAPHAHIAIRGTFPRADLRQVIAATYHQVWWPSTDTVRFEGDNVPEWHEPTGRYLNPETGEFLPSWEEALDSIGPSDEPLHVARFGPKFDAQGILSGTRDSSRAIGYLTKYLTKHIAGCHQSDTHAQAVHATRLADAVRYEPCSPSCANWLRYGIQPRNPRKDLVPGQCRGKAHQAANLGYAGRRILVSRKWSGKTLTDHRADRKAWLIAMLDLPATEPGRYTFERVQPADPDAMTPTRRLLHVLADRTRQHNAITQARQQARDHTEGSATGRAA